MNICKECLQHWWFLSLNFISDFLKLKFSSRTFSNNASKKCCDFFLILSLGCAVLICLCKSREDLYVDTNTWNVSNTSDLVVYRSSTKITGVRNVHSWADNLKLISLFLPYLTTLLRACLSNSGTKSKWMLKFWPTYRILKSWVVYGKVEKLCIYIMSLQKYSSFLELPAKFNFFVCVWGHSWS